MIYRRYASLFFIVGTKPDVGTGEENCENEMGMLEFIHTLVETMDKWAGSICELDIMVSHKNIIIWDETNHQELCHLTGVPLFSVSTRRCALSRGRNGAKWLHY